MKSSRGWRTTTSATKYNRIWACAAQPKGL